MKQPKYNWDTQFDTANNIMRHTFSDRVQVETNIKKGEAQVIVDGNLVNVYHSMPVKEYEMLLLSVEEYAYKLQRKTCPAVSAWNVAAATAMALVFFAAIIQAISVMFAG